jgi:hypothetical protein
MKMGFGVKMLAVVLLIASFAVLAYRQVSLQRDLTNHQNFERNLLAQLASAERATHEVDSLISGSFSLSARSVKAVPVPVTNGMSNVRLVGRFSAAGGMGNDVEVLLFDHRDDFTNWTNGHAAKVMYQSGRTTVGNLNVPLPATGGYTLVFSNTFAFFLPRTITADVKLEYDKRD